MWKVYHSNDEYRAYEFPTEAEALAFASGLEIGAEQCAGELRVWIANPTGAIYWTNR